MTARNENSTAPADIGPFDAMSRFRITYDGPALESSEMDVRELAPALLAFGDLLDASTRALCGDQVRPRVNVRGSFKTGSFGIDFTLATSLLGRMRDLLSGSEGTALANAVTILTALGIAAPRARKGLFAVLKWLRGREITHVRMKDHTAVLHVDGDTLEIDLPVLTLLRDVRVRRATAQVLAPLAREGIEIFAAGTDTEVYETVARNEIAWFHAPEPADALLLDEHRKMAFSIVSLAFKDDNKWRLYDGTSTIHATITDAGFLSRVNNSQISFSKGDVLLCNVRMQQWQTSDGAKTEYEVTDVLEHRPAGLQIPLSGL
ncbi:hypothetical protein SB394_19955 [Burkholderia sp. BCCIQ04A]|uniref:Uncharacterized protein n=1 Tax=Burkholderia anthinoferrum TaxID=3090833 RepID=A0ABU5WQ49_9BURK|nr:MULTISPECIES: hypothetical protein [Burkholderia]MEB2504322.1 hypothetical protein [Burkholderia anthinoferrum]MEB2531448.1 hypothetical protein [Burkholderia anthinoferrum]MEB2561279.1 hypothetical protein [Burkholderia anthinoferrum]MEB2581071.1 hypothetical protein [Burkholderia anthinoferrum]KVH07121.1 hypothetical protein WS85_22690 [Burkholderia anthina]